MSLPVYIVNNVVWWCGPQACVWDHSAAHLHWHTSTAPQDLAMLIKHPLVVDI